ncbi:MAG: glycosyltransferase [Clostridia bacterium]|nr:glycosyltransferase [Clostridia bacterium]
MKIAQFIDIFYPHVDGVVTAVDNYARIMNEAEGDYCCVFAPDNAKGVPEHEGGYDIYRAKSIRFIGGYLWPAPSVSETVKKAARTHSFDIVHAHSPFMMGHFARRFAKKQGVPFVCTFHSKYYDDFLRVTHSKFLARQCTAYVVRLYNKADEVWAVNEGTADTLREYGYKGKITVMRNGSDMAFAGREDELRLRAEKRFGIEENGKTLLFVGNQIWHKNIKLILDTLLLLKPEGYRLISVGDGYDLADIKKYAEKTGVADIVSFEGKVTDRELLAGLYASGDLLFFPSAYDNAPLVVLEAAAMGTPAMLLEGSNSADAVIDGINGFICPGDASGCAEAIRRAFADRERLKSIGAEAKKSVYTSWRDAVAPARAEYERIIGEYKKK